MSTARPSHAFALIPFSPADNGTDAACEIAVDKWVLALGHDYTLDAPRLVAENGRFYMYVSGTLVECAERQMEISIRLALHQAKLQQKAQEQLDTTSRPILAGASMGGTPRGPIPTARR